MSALDTILPASWRGQVFGVHEITNKFGRRTAIHEYPYRDSVWVEDLGSGKKSFGFNGFICGAFAEIQHAALALAVDKAGPGTLTHPSLGIFTGVVVAFSSHKSKHFVNGYDLEFEFVESVEPTYPNAKANTIAGVNLGALNIFSLAGTMAGTALAVVGIGLGLVTAAPGIVSALMSLPGSLASDAGALANSVTNIGAGYGPYASQSGTAVTADQAYAAQASVVAAVAASSTAAAAGDPTAIIAAVSAVPGTVAAAVSNPADQIRLLLPLTAATAMMNTAADAIGQAQTTVAAVLSALFRRSALAALAQAEAAYTPTSYDDAMATLASIVAALDAEITYAGDGGEDDMVTALIALRASVQADLNARGASLAPLRVISLPAPMPALALAQQLYQDGSRSDELIREADTWHPAFVSGAITVLAE
jgi:prophage DNA circulation protein